MGKRRLCALGAKVDLFADVLEAGVAHERAGQQTTLAEDLEAVADADDQSSGFGKLCHRRHDGREFGDGAGAQIVSIGKAARHNDGIAILEIMRLMPQKGDRLLRNCVDYMVAVVVAVRPWEDKNAKFHRTLSIALLCGCVVCNKNGAASGSANGGIRWSLFSCEGFKPLGGRADRLFLRGGVTPGENLAGAFALDDPMPYPGAGTRVLNDVCKIGRSINAHALQ